MSWDVPGPDAPAPDPFSPGSGESFGSRGSFCGVPHRRYDQAQPGEVLKKVSEPT